MAPPKIIENFQPDTLPADFDGWDEHGAAQAQPSVSRVPEPARQARTVPVVPTRNAAAPRPSRLYDFDEDRLQPSRAEAGKRVSRTDHVSGRSGKTMKVSLIALGAVVILSLAAAATMHFVRPLTQRTAVQQQAETTPVPAQGPGVIAKPSPSQTVKPTAAQDQQGDDQQADTGQAATGQVASNAMLNQLKAPSRISQNQFASSGGNAPSGNLGAQIGGMGGNAMPGMAAGGAAKVKLEAPKVVSISSGVAQGLLVHKTLPVYPMIARNAMAQGTVVLQARISKTGTVEDVKAISGPSLLRQAAIDAVKNWRYRPYLLDNQPVEVETTVDVVFTLGGG